MRRAPEVPPHPPTTATWPTRIRRASSACSGQATQKHPTDREPYRPLPRQAPHLQALTGLAVSYVDVLAAGREPHHVLRSSVVRLAGREAARGQSDVVTAVADRV